MKALTGLVKAPQQIAALLLSGLIVACGDGYTTSDGYQPPKRCEHPNGQLIEDFCGGCPDGWMLIDTTPVDGVCCIHPNKNQFWSRSGQCPAGAELSPAPYYLCDNTDNCSDDPLAPDKFE